MRERRACRRLRWALIGLGLLAGTARSAEVPSIYREVDPVRLRQSLEWLTRPPESRALMLEAAQAFLSRPDTADLGRLWQLALRQPPEPVPKDAGDCAAQLASFESLQQRNPLQIWLAEALAGCHRASGDAERARQQDVIRRALIRDALRAGRGVTMQEPIRLYTPRDLRPLFDDQGWTPLYASATPVGAVLEVLVREQDSPQQRLLYLDAVSAPLATVPVADREAAWRRLLAGVDATTASLYAGGVRFAPWSAEAPTAWRTRADSGDLGAAMFLIRRCLSQPELGCAAEAVERARGLADREMGTVSAALSFAHAEGRGVEADVALAAEWQSRAEKQLGRASAAWERCRLLGLPTLGGGAPDCLAEAAALEHPDALLRKAIESGDSARFLHLARAGSATSQVLIGNALDGNRDLSGIEWLRKSVQQGHVLGGHSLTESLFNPEQPFREADELFWSSEFVAQNYVWGWAPRLVLSTTLLYRGQRELTFGRPEAAATWFAQCHDVHDLCLVEWYGVAAEQPVAEVTRTRMLQTVERLGQRGHAAALALTQAHARRLRPGWPDSAEIDRLRKDASASAVGPLLLAEALIASGQHSAAIQALARCDRSLHRCASLQAHLRSRLNPADPGALLDAAQKAAGIGSPRRLAAYAKYLCTLPQYEHRDGPFGLALAMRAAEALPEASLLAVLAACLAENEYFEEAVQIQQRALAQLPRDAADARSVMEAALRDYRAGDYLILQASVGSLDDRPWSLQTAPATGE